jgi:multidrug resistance efflux pump
MSNDLKNADVSNDGLLTVTPEEKGKYVRSEDAQEIIEYKGGMLEKSALFIFLFILIVVLTGTFFVRYPEIIQTRATINSHNGPSDIIPLQSGRITHLFVSNGEAVKQGEVIAYIESSGDPKQIQSLSELVKTAIDLLHKNQVKNMSDIFNKRFENLGEVQTFYQTFITSLLQFNDYYVNGFYNQKQSLLKEDLSSLHLVDKGLGSQRELVEKDRQLALDNLEMNEKLFNEKIISAEEYRAEKSKVLNKEMTVPQINTNILSNKTQQRDKLKELDQIRHDIVQQKITLSQALQTFKSAIDNWMKQYVICAPISGTLNLIRPLQQGQYVQSGRNVGFVSASGIEQYVELYLPQNNLGRVDTGMNIQLRLDAYPYQEHGIVKCKLDYISKVASDSGYLATARLENGLNTNQGYLLEFKNGLRGDAMIITKDMTFFKRIYYSMVKITSVNK